MRGRSADIHIQYRWVQRLILACDVLSSIRGVTRILLGGGLETEKKICDVILMAYFR